MKNIKINRNRVRHSLLKNVRLIIINSNGNENRQNNLAPNGGKQQ